MSTHDNGPPMDGWTCEPRPCVILPFLPRMRWHETPDDEPHIVRGEN